MYRRDRNRRYRDDDYIVEEVYYEEDPYYYEEETGSWWVSLLGILFVVGILVVLVSVLFRPSVRRTRYRQGPMTSYSGSPKTAQSDFQAVPIGKPKIDLKAVEDALWQTKSKNSKDFNGWMKKFEDEVNAIYFATLRRQSPKADPATLMKQPIRVEPKKVKNLLTIYGYSDDNKKKGFQNGEDKLIFVFQQTKPYQRGSKKLHYSLRDSTGYYYRSPTYVHSYASMAYTPFLLGFFVYPTIWYGMWYRPMFGWWGPGFYSRGFFYSRYNHYYRGYPAYRTMYRRTYYSRHRPWGWNRGSYYRRGSNGRYTSRTSRYRGGRYRGGSRNRYRGGSRNRYRGGSRNRYRSRGGNRYRSGSRNRYRGGSRNRYRSGSRNRGGSRNRYRSRRRSSWGGRRSRYRSRRRSWGRRSFGRRSFGGFGRRRR